MNPDSLAIDIAMSLRDSKLISQDKFDRVLQCVEQCLARNDRYDGKCPDHKEWETMRIPGIGKQS